MNANVRVQGWSKICDIKNYKAFTYFVNSQRRKVFFIILIKNKNLFCSKILTKIDAPLTYNDVFNNLEIIEKSKSA